MSKEEEYDQIVAPLILKVAQICKELGMTMIARIEWAPGECGITQSGDWHWSASQILACYAAHVDGNFDLLAKEILREIGVGNSMILKLCQGKSKGES